MSIRSVPPQFASWFFRDWVSKRPEKVSRDLWAAESQDFGSRIFLLCNPNCIAMLLIRHVLHSQLSAIHISKRSVEIAGWVSYSIYNSGCIRVSIQIRFSSVLSLAVGVREYWTAFLRQHKGLHADVIALFLLFASVPRMRYKAYWWSTGVDRAYQYPTVYVHTLYEPREEKRKRCVTYVPQSTNNLYWVIDRNRSMRSEIDHNNMYFRRLGWGKPKLQTTYISLTTYYTYGRI